jgi:hypothetical protein
MARPRAIYVLLASLLCGAAARGQERDVAAEIETILDGVERPADVIGMRDALADLAGKRLDLLFAYLSTETDLLRQAALIAALDKLPRDAVLAHLAGRAREPMSEEERRSALDLLARMGRRSELKLCLELAGASTAGAPLETRLRESLERALAGICEREPTAPRALATYFARAQPAVQTVIADIIAARGGDEALPLLAELLDGASAQTAGLLLLAIGDVAQHTDFIEDLLALDRARPRPGRRGARAAARRRGARALRPRHRADPRRRSRRAHLRRRRGFAAGPARPDRAGVPGAR